MKKYILRFCGQGAKPAADVDLIRGLPHTKVLDDSRRMLLVEAPAAELRNALQNMSDWVMAEERMVPLPDPRPSIRRKAAVKGQK